MESTEFRHTAGRAGFIGLSAFIGALVGFALQLLVAYYFGAGSETDAYFMASSTSELLSKLLMGGSLTSVFIPIFVDRLTRGERADAWRLSLNVLHIMGGVYLLAIVMLGFFAEPFTRLIAPGFDEKTFDLTVSLLKVLLPSFFFMFLVDLATSILHSLRQFTVPALLRIVAPSVSILSIALLVRHVGIYALAIGTVVGGVIQLSLLARALYKQGLSYRFVFQPSDKQVKNLFYLVYPFAFSVLVTQGAGVVYRILVSDLSIGSLASLKFAEKITQFLIIMFLNSVTMVIYPLLAEKASRKDIKGIHQTVGSSIRLIFFVTIPLVIGVALLRHPLVAFLYQRGHFSAEDAQMTAAALLFLIIGMTTNGISAVFGYTVLALKQTKVSVAVTICSQAIAIALFMLLVPRMQHAGLALASSLVPISSAVLYFLYLTRTVPHLASVFWHKTYIQTIVLGTLLATVITVVLRIVQPLVSGSPLAAISQIVIPTALGSLVFFGGAYLWKIHEMHELLAIVSIKLRKWGWQ